MLRFSFLIYSSEFIYLNLVSILFIPSYSCTFQSCNSSLVLCFTVCFLIFYFHSFFSILAIPFCSSLYYLHSIFNNPLWEYLFLVFIMFFFLFLSCFLRLCSLSSSRTSAGRHLWVWCRLQQELCTTRHRLGTKPQVHKFKGSDIRTRLGQTEFGPPPHPQ